MGYIVLIFDNKYNHLSKLHCIIPMYNNVISMHAWLILIKHYVNILFDTVIM